MLDDILDSFSLSRPLSVKQIPTGLVNQTYKIMNSDGIFALQSLHPIFPDETVKDMRTVTDFLAGEGFRVPKLIPTNSGEYYMRDHNNLRWRLYSWIDGKVHTRVKDENMVYEAGKIVGKLHQSLAKLGYKPEGTLPHFHDTKFVLEKLAEAADQLPAEGRVLAKAILTEAPATIIDESLLASQIIHGDLKVANLLFDDSDNAIGIIDFDTLMWRPRAIDMGDALRSWCNRTEEDGLESVFDQSYFEAAERGYFEMFQAPSDERALQKQATKQIAYELAARFLTDVVNDNYFGFDDTRYATRQEHNLARTKAQLHLARSIKI